MPICQEELLDVILLRRNLKEDLVVHVIVQPSRLKICDPKKLVSFIKTYYICSINNLKKIFILGIKQKLYPFSMAVVAIFLDVIVKQKNTLQIKLGSGDVLIEPDFEVEKEAMLEIK